MGRKTTRRRRALGGGGQVRASVAAAVWLIGGLVIGDPAHGMQFLRVPPSAGCQPVCLTGQGVIEDTTVKQFALFIRREHVAGRATLVLDSGGGVHVAGISLGEAVRKAGFTTQVGRYDPVANRLGPGACASACVYALLGGVSRSVVPGSRVGVHQVRLNDESPALTGSDVQLLMALAADHVARSGATSRLT